jgi:hypothetical protein
MSLNLHQEFIRIRVDQKNNKEEVFLENLILVIFLIKKEDSKREAIVAGKI